MRNFLKATVCACVLLGAPSITFAQEETKDTAPRSLAPRTLTPNAQTVSQPNVTPTPMKTISGGINVQSLDSVSSEALGALSGKEALPSDMWSGVERGFVEKLIATLPATPTSPYLRILQRRLLLTAAQPPQGQSGEKSLLALRAGKLAEMGQTGDVVSLIHSAPQSDRNTDLARLETETLLLGNKTSQACAVAAGHTQTSQDPFWTKALAFCRMLAKQNDQAMLSLSLLQEMGDNDPVYYDLMDAMNLGETAKIDSLPAPSPLILALIDANKAKLSDEVKNTDSPNLLSLLAKTNDVGVIEKAVRYNLADIKLLRDAYQAIEFKDAEKADALTTAESLDPIKAQALLYQVGTQANQLAVIRSETIAMALELSKNTGNYFTISKLYQPVITNMARSVDMLWFAPIAVRSLLAAGDWETAKAWYLLLRNAAFTDAEAAKSWSAVRPLAAFAGFDVAPQAVNQALTNWWSAQPERPESFARAVQIYSIADGLGLTVPNTLWLALMDGPKLKNGASPKAGIEIKLNKAALAGRVGETVLMALHGLAQDEPHKMDATFLRNSLFGLRAVGLEHDARIIAVETALMAGL